MELTYKDIGIAVQIGDVVTTRFGVIFRIVAIRPEDRMIDVQIDADDEFSVAAEDIDAEWT